MTALALPARFLHIVEALLCAAVENGFGIRLEKSRKQKELSDFL